MGGGWHGSLCGKAILHTALVGGWHGGLRGRPSGRKRLEAWPTRRASWQGELRWEWLAWQPSRQGHRFCTPSLLGGHPTCAHLPVLLCAFLKKCFGWILSGRPSFLSGRRFWQVIISGRRGLARPLLDGRHGIGFWQVIFVVGHCCGGPSMRRVAGGIAQDAVVSAGHR
jgi:hypothetical protein